MQLILKLQENLAVNQLAIERNTTRLPFAYANYYRYNNSQEVDFLKRQIQTAEQRLDWFEPLLEFPILQQFTEIETTLIQSRRFFTDAGCQQLILQWLQAVDRIGDLNQPQELIYQFAIRLKLLFQSWSSLSKTYQQIEEIVNAGPEENQKNLLTQFQMNWEKLWCYLPDLESLDADLAIGNALQNLSQLEVNV